MTIRNRMQVLMLSGFAGAVFAPGYAAADNAQLSNPAVQDSPSAPASTSAQAAAREPTDPFAALAAYAPAAPTNAPLLTKAPPPTDACTSFEHFRDTDCSLTWHGITIYGTYDIGAG